MPCSLVPFIHFNACLLVLIFDPEDGDSVFVLQNDVVTAWKMALLKLITLFVFYFEKIRSQAVQLLAQPPSLFPCWYENIAQLCELISFKPVL
jgi:hypothetical protein